MARQPGFFDTDERQRWLSEAGDPLERLAAVVDFELFRPELEAALKRSDRAKGGRPPHDAVLMFRYKQADTTRRPSFTSPARSRSRFFEVSDWLRDGSVPPNRPLRHQRTRASLTEQAPAQAG